MRESRLYRSRTNRMIGGVCSGLGDFAGIDPTLVRLGFVVVGLVGFALQIVLVYLIMLLVVPEEPAIRGVDDNTSTIRDPLATTTTPRDITRAEDAPTPPPTPGVDPSGGTPPGESQL
jgi:phage shock protein C